MAKEKMKKSTAKNKLLFNEAKKHLVAGVDSPVRSFSYVGGVPVLFEKGKGSKIYDYDGNEYIDYVLSFGALILGHAYPSVLKSLKKRADKGLCFGATSLDEIELAKFIKKAIPLIEKIRFVNSGTEAVMGALRLARGYTKRKKIIKFVNSYHGHADYLLAKGGSGLASLNISASEGVPADFVKHTIVIEYANRGELEQAFKKYPTDIAAIIVEPVGGNYGVSLPDKQYLKYLRDLSKKYKSLLVFDEVITGFRFKFGSVADMLGVEPDLICLGKIIGGGLPVGAYGGPRRIMDKLAPLGEVYQASTFGGNPVVMQTGLATLKELKSQKGQYKKLGALTTKFISELQNQAKESNIDLKIAHYGSMFSLKFKRKKEFQFFYKALLKRGVYLAPSEYEANFLSFAHSEQDINKTIKLTKEALRELKTKGV